jgi:hypothetical protein
MKWLSWIATGVLGLLAVPASKGQENLPRFEAGPVFSFLHQPNMQTVNQFEVGGRFSYNLFSHVGVDAEYVISPFRSAQAGFFEGGRINQGFLGLKAGRRWEKWGISGKFRPGVVAYSNTIRSLSFSAPSFRLRAGWLMEPALDAGGVVEFYLSRRILLRYDTGDTIILYRSQSVTNSTSSKITLHGFTRNAFQFSTGFSFRF